jgi:protein-disulfide isomerase
MSSRQEQKARARAEREARERAQARAEQRRRRLLQLGGVLAVAAAIVVVLVLVSQGGKDGKNASSGGALTGVSDVRAMLGGVPQQGTRLGDPKAPMVLTEFADLQCPFCRDYALEVLPQVVEHYVRTGKLRLELRLRSFIGDDSVTAARAAAVAATRNRLWNFAELFYRNQGTENTGYVTDAFLSRIATAVGVPGSLVTAARTQTPALERPLQTAESEAEAAGQSSTPSFLIGPKAGTGKPLALSAIDFASMRAAIDAELR